MIVHEIVEELMTIKEDSWAIQLGAFKQKGNASRLQKKLKKQLGKEVEIVVENGFHKVRVLELKDRDEVNATLSILHEKGFNVFWVVRLKAMQQLVVLKEVSDTVFQVVEVAVDAPVESSVIEIREEEIREKEPEPVIVQEVILQEVIEEEILAQPKVALQAGVFSKRSEAMRAKKRIESKLDVTVEIIEKWDYYRVVIKGFYTKEETSRFYPELVGLGYDNIMLIDESGL
jgi:cell division protein FtsN